MYLFQLTESLLAVTTFIVLYMPRTDSVGITVTVDRVCPKSVELRWTVDSDRINSSTIHHCDMVYVPTTGAGRFIEDHTIYASNTIELLKLLEKTKYNFYISCQNGLQSNIVTFTTGNCTSEIASTQGLQRPQKTQERTSLAPVEYKSSSLFSANALDAVLGIVFGLVAVVIISISVFYLWRRFKRRQRVQRYYSTLVRDPFDNLQSDHGSTRWMIASSHEDSMTASS